MPNPRGAVGQRTGGFDAFITYSRTSSGTKAAALHGALERCAKSWYKKRSCHVFRDDSVMSADASLGDSIKSALREAPWLIVIASPAAADSQWVNREIRDWWAAHGDSTHIILVHDQGRISWDRDDFSPSAEAVPAALRGRFQSEPRWVDMTWFDGALSGAQDPRFTEVVHQVAAPILGIPRDEIGGHAAVQHRRTMRVARAALATLSFLLVGATVLGALAVSSRNEAQSQLRIATSQQLAAQSVTLRKTDVATAQQLAVGAYQLDSNSQTRAALLGAAVAGDGLVASIPLPFLATVVQSLPGGEKFLLGGELGRIALLDISTLSVTELGPFGLTSEPTCMSASPDGRVVVTCSWESFERTVGRVFLDGKLVQVVNGTDVVGVVNPDATVTMAATGPGDQTTVYRLDSVSFRPQVLVSIPGYFDPQEMAINNSGLVVVGFGNSSGDRCYVSLQQKSGKVVKWGYVHVPVETFIVSREPIYPVLTTTGERFAAVNIVENDLTVESGYSGLGLEADASHSCAGERYTSAMIGTPIRISIPQKPTAIAVAPEADVFAAADGNGIAVYRPGIQGSPQQQLGILKGTGPVQQGHLFMPDARTIISITESAASVWRPLEGNGLVTEVTVVKAEEALRETGCTACSAGSPNLSPGGRVLVTRADGGEVSTWYDTKTAHSTTFSGEVVAWNSSVSAIARRDEEWVTITDGVETGVAQAPGAPSPTPDVQHVGGGNVFSVILDASTSETVNVASIATPAVSPDMTMIASQSEDNRLILTDVQTSIEVASFDVDGERVKEGALGFAQDGSFVALDQWDYDGNSVITLVNLQPAVWRAAACASAQGPLATTSLAKFLPTNSLPIRTCPPK